MQVKVFPTDLLGACCYLVYSQGEAFIIDPAGIDEGILEVITAEKLKVKAIINTHGHADHIFGNKFLKELLQAPIWIHSADATMLTDPVTNLSIYVRQNVVGPKADRLLQEGDRLILGREALEVWHTPGHSPGSICLVGEGIAFTGDTLFCGSIGRIDFPGGDGTAMAESLARLKGLPAGTVIYPGHGPATVIDDEIATNPYLQHI